MKNKYRIVGDVVFIQLRYKGKRLYTRIDRSDLPKVDIKGTWQVKTRKGREDQKYVTMNKVCEGKWTYTSIHRLVTDCPNGKLVDHLDRNTLDNRKENLRVCTHQDNMENKQDYRGSKRPYRNVIPHSGGFEVAVRRKGERIYLGFFKELNDAILMAKMWEF